VAKFYATAMPQSVAVATGVAYFVPFVPDEQVTTEIDGTAYLEAKTAAMRAHATQIVVDSGRFALSTGRWQPLLAQEYYTLLAWGATPLSRDTPDPDGPGTPRGASPAGAAHGTREHDLFAGLDGR
jgi:N-acetyl-1-D-myo-inositol-2-amino-2-deoxy-alpha-D-glucopyranoside deacetylase